MNDLKQVVYKYNGISLSHEVDELGHFSNMDGTRHAQLLTIV